MSSQYWRDPDDGAPFLLDGPNDLAESGIDPENFTLARYIGLLPVDYERLVTLGAGMTPLIPGELAGETVWFKLDSLLPTGSFKDRGAAVLVAHLWSLGVESVVVDSSGNAAAAMSAYCAAVGMRCTVYAPASASPGKLVQARAYGAGVVPIDGSRDDVASAAQDAADHESSAYYASHNWNPVFAEGVKTWALEVWEQLGGRSPVAAFVPAGGGSAFVGGYRGFAATGEIPQLLAAQPRACAPLVNAWVSDATETTPVTPDDTLAEGAKIGNPARGGMMLDAIRESSGDAVAVAESDLIEALHSLWQQGIYAEPTASLGAAAFVSKVRDGWHVPEGPVVVHITGSGLKATDTIAHVLEG
ncbi:MAG: pyridoxal-phosphate dependent enzyme [Chloroflexota bacterium]